MPPPVRAIHLFIVRHGETDWNVSQRIQGHRDLPLNDRGLKQAEALGRYFADKRVDAVYSSDRLRARQTAQPIATAVNRRPFLDAGLRERNYGRCEGLTREALAADYPEDAHALKARDPDYVLPEGESLRQHRRRLFAALDRLLARHSGQTVVVTHGGVLDQIFRRVTGMALESPRHFPIPNGGINRLSVRGGEWSIESWGETGHLGK